MTALITVNVLCRASDQLGNPIAGAVITAKLSGPDVDATNGYVLPEIVSGIADINGLLTLALWPNALGSTETYYDIKITNPDTGKKIGLTATIPNAACELHLVAGLPPYEGKSDGQLAIDAAVAAVAPAIAAKLSAEAALVSTTVQAGIATTQAGISTTQAAAASASAASALSSQNSATGSAGTATAQADIATADVVLTHADVAFTHADVALTHSDVTSTHADVVLTHADVALLHADVLLTNADVALTHADVVLTHADVVLTHADAATASSGASTSTTQAGIATTQAGIATTQATNSAASAAAALASQNSASASESTATAQAVIATAQAGSSVTSAGTATTQAGIATAQAGTATTQAGIATTGAGTATAQALIATNKADLATADVVLTHADVATTNADVLLTHADVASTHADVVLTHADVVTTNADAATATAQAGVATTQAGTATTQAGIATTKAGEASASASAALASQNSATASAATATSGAATATAQAAAASSNAGIATAQNTAAGISAGQSSSSATQSAAARDLAIAAWNASMAPAETLPAISRPLHIGAVVKAILDFPSTHSDGGAWTDCCSDKNWYTETLGGDRWLTAQATIAAAWTAAGSATGAVFQASATAGPLTIGKFYAATSATTATEVFRGIRRDYPKSGVAWIAETGRVIGYDLSTGAMWRVILRTGKTLTSIAAMNGSVMVASTTGLFAEGFIADQIGLAEKYTTTTTPAIVNNAINDIAITVLDNAPIDPATGLPVPTIYAFTAGGVSRISDAGTVSSTASTACTSGWIEGNYAYASNGALVGGWKTDTALPTGGASAINAYWTALSYSSTTIPALWPTAPTLAKGTNGAVGHALGLTKIKHNPASTTLGMVAAITNAYNSGWMVGDIRGAWLADTVAETITGSDLVTGDNSTFTGGIGDWVSSGTWAGTAVSVSGEMEVTPTVANGRMVLPITLVVGKTYAITGTAKSVAASIAQFGISTNNSGSYSGGILICTADSLNPTVTTTGYLTATQTTYWLSCAPNATSNFDNISVKLAEPDRSVRNKGGVIVGTLTKSPVASGAQLVGYSGWSASNYEEWAYDSGLDFGTGDFCVMGWLNTAINGTMASRGDGISAGSWKIKYINATYLVLYIHNGSTWVQSSASLPAPSKTTTLVALVRISGVVYTYFDGVLAGSYSGALTVTNATAKLQPAKAQEEDFVNPATNISLFRISATAPSADQIAHIYRTELALFQPNAKCLIDGTSTAVSAKPEYDESTDLLHVPTSWGRSAFKDFLRTESEATTTGSITSLSANQGAILTGGTSAKYYQPAMLLRDELRRKEEARKALGKVPVFIEFDAVTSQVAFVVTKGYTIKAVYSAGTLKRVGSTKDYTVSFDGFQETITFAVAPGNAVWVSAMCVRA